MYLVRIQQTLMGLVAAEGASGFREEGVEKVCIENTLQVFAV